MRAQLIRTAVAAFALSQAVVATASAEQTAFRTPEPQAFSAQDLQHYGLDAAQTQRAMQLQDSGYQIVALTPEEAEAYTAGITDNQWLLIGILVGVVVIAVAVAD
ncbi:MAG: hypothetical protein GC189_06410 [Alphaproteobacteria bacterium]|nr:hypothetical protein [Alphaproteobacteria bacterium]